jgi:hypothetical protein
MKHLNSVDHFYFSPNDVIDIIRIIGLAFTSRSLNFKELPALAISSKGKI